MQKEHPIPIHPKVRSACLALILALTLIACTRITTVMPDGRETTRTREEFETYVESVFRRQNQALLEAGEMLESPLDPNNVRQLEYAEKRVLQACGALNQVAREKMENHDPDILLEIKVKDSIGDCDFATKVLEEVIVESK